MIMLFIMMMLFICVMIEIMIRFVNKMNIII